MNIVNCEQGTPEWLQARAGRVTASRISDVMAKGKGNAEATTRRDYKMEIVNEITTGQPTPSGFTNDAMRWGTEQEPFARAEYEMLRGVMVDQIGMVLHPTIERGAASPDGLVGNGLVEIKCPKGTTHLDYRLSKEAPAKYHLQMLWQLACTGAEWCDFVSFDPRQPEHLRLFVVRFQRDDARIAEIEAEVIKFLGEVDEIVAKLNASDDLDR